MKCRGSTDCLPDYDPGIQDCINCVSLLVFDKIPPFYSNFGGMNTVNSSLMESVLNIIFRRIINTIAMIPNQQYS